VNKKNLIFILLFLAGCSRYVPPAPDYDIGGVMDINITEKSSNEDLYIQGIFKVDGEKKEISIYFQDEFSMPRGMVRVRKKKIKEDTVEFNEDFNQIMKYWPVLFKESKKNLKGIEMDYQKWTQVNDRSLPGQIIIDTPEMLYNIKINYGN
jgi:hypothetical protein